jgi:ubiquinone/menaquinone biosynthesis C-methylase UbiE
VFIDRHVPTARFPRASKYHPDWIASSVSGGANSLWLAEWLSQAMRLEPGMRVLDLGCGRAASSIFLSREFGVQTWATDLWFSPSENLQRVVDAGESARVFPLRADARALPFADDFFDAIVSVDSFVYYGTDDLYLANLARFLKPGGVLAIAGAGVVNEVHVVPRWLQPWWEPSLACLHSAPWWWRHWERSGIVDVERADTMEDGWQFWLDWQRRVCPDNVVELAAVEEDAGRTLGYVRVIARRKTGVPLDAPIVSIATEYQRHPLLKP